jgi:hypothetical protein
MINAMMDNRVTLSALLRAAWFIIDTGQRVCALSETLEGHEAYTVRSNLAWKLRSVGENLERPGERLESHADARGHAADDILAPLIAARSVG